MGVDAEILTYPSTASLRSVTDDPLAFLEALAATGHDVVPCAVGRRQAFLVNHPALIEDVLVRHAGVFVKGRGYARAGRLLGRGLLTASGPLHASRRRLVQPAFQQVTAYARTMVDHAARAAARWQPGAVVDAGHEMRALTLGIAGATLLGADLACRADEIRDALALATPSLDGLLSVVAPPFRVRRARRRLEAIVDEVVARRLRAGDARDDLLSLLLTGTDDDEAQHVRDDAVTFLLAGHDTMAHALTWTWLLLADHPGVARRLRAELAGVLEGRLPVVEDLPRLGYMRAVFAEALRLRPPAWVIVREAARDQTLGGIRVPARALVIVSPWVMHRDARFFPDPLVFDPARWTAPDAGMPKRAYLPFGAGGRSCIGERFAWMEGTLVLATLARQWRLTAPAYPVPPEPLITLRPRGPVMMVPAIAD